MRLRRLFIALAALVAVSLPASVAAQSMESAILADLDAYWAGQAAALGIEYSPPAMALVEGEVSTSCGPVDPYILGPAAYCPLDSTIYVAPLWEQMYGPAEWITILAHEWAHHMQNLNGRTGYPTEESELQADCLAGAYVADAEARGAAPAGTFQRGMGASIRAGAPPFLPDGVDVHGTGAERGTSYMDGYARGAAVCGLS